METFTMNGYYWIVKRVNRDDPILIDESGEWTVGVTDPETMTVYISNEIDGAFFKRVLIHELSHCALFSFDLLEGIHRMVYPIYWTEAEEWICNFIADYGLYIFSKAKSILGEDAIYIVPQEIEKIVA
jgi:hypothetical protein